MTTKKPSGLVAAGLALLLCANAGLAETIENRDGQSLIATWWGADPLPPFAYTLDFGNTQYVHSAPFSLRIDYNKNNHPSNANSFVSAMGRWNFRNHDYLSFWVYNNGSPLKIRIRLEDKNGNPWESNWAGIEPEMKTAAADWENLTVDLTRSFAATNVDFTCIQQLMFIVAPDNQTTNGALWIDDIALTRSPNQAAFEPFESDFFGWSAGGAFSIVTNTTAQFQNSGTPTSLGQRSLQINWGNKPAANWDNFIFTPAHDPAAPADRIGKFTNFTLYGNTAVEGWIKSTTDNNMPILLKFSGSGGTADVATATYTGAGAWQKLTWNFAAIPGVASKLQTAWLFPYPNLADGGGTMYLDNFGLTGGTGPALPLAPTSLATTATSPDGDGIYTARWSSVSGITGYQMHEATSVNFTAYTTFTTNATAIRFARSVTSAGMTYYYRVASYIVSGGVTNLGCFSAPAIVTVKQIPAASRRYDTLDNFNGQKQVAAWWGSDPVAPYVYTLDFVNTQRVHAGTQSLRVDFDKRNDTNNVYGFFSAMGNYNLRNFDYLSMWVWNSGAVVRFRVRLEDDQGRPWESNWAGIEPSMKTAAADWENLVVDLTRTFSAHNITNIDMTKIRQVMFMVEPGSATNNGTVWMDDIEFHRAANAAPIETFESDFYGWSSGGPFSIVTNAAQKYNNGSQTGLGQQSLRITWTNKLADYSNIVYIPGHDAAAAPGCRIGNYTNLLANSNGFLELYVMSATDNNLPILLKVDNADVSVQTYTGAGAWQRMTWDYSKVAGVSTATGIYLYPYPNQADATGTVYIDDLNLIGGSLAAVPYAPTTIVASAVTTGTFTLSWNAIAGAAGYRIQESRVSDFTTIDTTYTNATASRVITKSPYTGGGTYFFRVASYVTNGGLNVGNFGAPTSVVVIPVANYKAERLDGFENDSLALTWWAADGAYPYAYDLDFGSTQFVHSGAYALKVSYNKANDPASPYTFFSAMGQYNLRSYDYLSFWVYNTGAIVKIKLRLEDRNANAFESDWANISLQTRSSAADWENLVFDLTRTFGATNINMAEITQIMFMVAPGSTNEAGVFWMDDLQFSRAVNSAPLDAFEGDKFGWIAGTNFPMVVVSNQFHNDGSVNGLGQQCLRVSWTNKAAGYENFIYQPQHDAGVAPVCRIGNISNFAANGNGYLELWVKSTTDNNMPILLKFDDYDVGVQNYTGAGQWQRLLWNYSALSRATNVAVVWFFPYPALADAGGTIFVDDLNLIGGNTPAIPDVPPGLAASWVTMGSYTVSWNSVASASKYQLQESMHPEFQSGVTAYTVTNLAKGFVKNPTAQFGNWYYRIRSGVTQGGADTFGSFSKPITVYVPQVTTNNGAAVNSSYPTDCAEVDNVSAGLKYTNTSAYRITVTHPQYYVDYGTNVLNERGADFDDCHFTDRRIWIVGTNNGGWGEFRSSGFGVGDVYYPIDNPMKGIDEAWSNFPQEINRDWMQEQFFNFTAEELGDVDLEYKVGSDIEVSFALISGSMTITASAKSVNGWVGLGTRTFNTTTRTNIWTTPDFTWAQGTDTNRVWLRVLPSSDPGAWGIYDYVEMRKRGEAGGRLITNMYDNGNVIVDAYDVDFWWRTPATMTVQVLGGLQTNCDYFVIVKKVPETNYTSYSQIFVLYEDGNVRLLPHPPSGVDWTPFGASVIVGASPDIARPFAGINTVLIDPDDLSMDITFDDGGSCHVEMWVDQEKNVVDVSQITYNTSTNVFARFRSMWVCDGKADIDRVETASGVYPISENWSSLNSTWWQFFKESPTYHNTYCPDFRMEVMEPSPAFLVRQFEDYDSATNALLAFRAAARNTRVMTTDKTLGSTLTYQVGITQDRQDVTMLIRYADDDGGNNGSFPGNLIQVYVDGVLKDQTRTVNTAGWEDFERTPGLFLGNLSAGSHTIRVVVQGLTFGCDLDEFQLMSQPVAPWTKTTILTRQGEAYTAASNQTVATRAGATGGQSIHVDQAGGFVSYNLTIPTATSNTYVQLRYSDDLGPTKLDLYLDGVLAGRFPTRDGASWTDWMLSSELYLGALSAGAHTLRIEFYPETYGADIDQFEIYRYQP